MLRCKSSLHIVVFVEAFGMWAGGDSSPEKCMLMEQVEGGRRIGLVF